MKKIIKLASALVMAVSLTACSSGKKTKTASDTGMVKVEENYTQTANKGDYNFVEKSFNGITYKIPEEFRERKLSNREEVDYSIKGTNDKIEIWLAEGVSASEDDIDSLEFNEEFHQGDVSEYDFNGTKGLLVDASSVVYTQIVLDANAELYMIPVEKGCVCVEVIHDPSGSMDYSPLFDEFVGSITVA